MKGNLSGKSFPCNIKGIRQSCSAFAKADPEEISLFLSFSQEFIKSSPVRIEPRVFDNPSNRMGAKDVTPSALLI